MHHQDYLLPKKSNPIGYKHVIQVWIYLLLAIGCKKNPDPTPTETVKSTSNALESKSNSNSSSNNALALGAAPIVGAIEAIAGAESAGAIKAYLLETKLASEEAINTALQKAISNPTPGLSFRNTVIRNLPKSKESNFKLSDRVKAGDPYHYHIKTDLEETGNLKFDIKATPESPVRGTELFNRAMVYHGSSVKSITGEWEYGSNLAVVNEAVKEAVKTAGFNLEKASKTEIENLIATAAKSTFTGKRAASYGFTDVVVVKYEIHQKKWKRPLCF